jgi:Fe-S oxidoreductase
MPEGGGWLFVELGGATKEEADAHAHELMAKLERDRTTPSMKLFDDREEEAKAWAVREAGLGATAHEPGGRDAWPGWEDSAVAPEAVGPYLRGLRGLYDRYGYNAALYGHFGQGCIHTRIEFDLFTAEGIAKFRSFMDDAADLVLAHGGSLSGEHGDGQSRAELLPKMFGEELVNAFREFKGIWDPENRMNPGKVVDPAPIVANLRIGSDYAPWDPVTVFHYPDDQGSFARAGGLRCVGIGNCRREGGGTMCPSYMVTHDEQHSTRGRARLLFEMMQGEVITDGWRSEAVRDALDLCLACKGCFGDCPVNVDMATYKAEFLAHHYAHRLRPRAHYALGWLPTAARWAAPMSRFVNAVTHTPGLEAAAKWTAGIEPEREIPRFATSTLRQRVGQRTPHGKQVLLWPDTFTNYFEPEIGEAAIDVLEHAGFGVGLPQEPLCCGLTWISTGQLAHAKRVLRRTVRALAPAARSGTPIICLEPSCAAVFRHDLHELFPNDPDAGRIRDSVHTLAELLDEDAQWEVPRLKRNALVQRHCHHQAVLGFDTDERLLDRVGVEADVLDSGCCGLAGNFGFERGHHEVSMACAERVLAPAVRSASDATLIVADGFSCRTQIAATTNRRALHLAQVLAMAIHEGEPGMVPKYRPERAFASEQT